jgi:hypothetical protein
MHLRASITAAVVWVLCVGMGVAHAQYASPSPKAETPADVTMKAGAANLSAKLVDAEAKAKKQAATVEVTVKGLTLIDPAKVNEVPAKNQGHLHYQVDDGPIIATTTPKLSFHGLKPGTHTILVALAANDHAPLGPQEKLTVTIP